MNYSQYLKLLLFLLAATVNGGTTLVDTDFGKASTEVKNKKNLASGYLPNKWMDDSSWANVRVTYEPMQENGEEFTRIHITDCIRGNSQAALPEILNAEKESIYKLSFRLRNTGDSDIEIGLRQKNNPFKFIWSVRHFFSKKWKDYTFVFRLPTFSQTTGVWISSYGNGQYDISSLKLERFTDQQYTDKFLSTPSTGVSGNLFSCSRFPLGFPSGWYPDREYSDGDDIIIGNADFSGPSGIAPLNVTAPQACIFRTSAFKPIVPTSEHEVSFYAGGDGIWNVTLLQEDLVVKKLQIPLTQKLARISIPFSPVIAAQFYQLQFEGKGSLNLDGLYAGPINRGFNPKSVREVALSLPESDASPAGIVFEDEPFAINWCVTGQTDGFILKTNLTDLYDNSVELADIKISGSDFIKKGNLPLPVNPDYPYGCFRVEAFLIDTNGNHASDFSERIIYRLRRPLYWGENAPQSSFGVHTNPTRRHLLMAKSIGINWVRLHDAGLQYIGWWRLEPEKGNWNFFDNEILRYKNYHMSILAELGTAPPWASYYSPKEKTQFNYFDKFFQPKNAADFYNYASRVSERYHSVIDAFDVWNEPWRHAWWAVSFNETKGVPKGYETSKNPRKDYTDLMEAAYKAVKTNTPNACIVGFNTTTANNSNSFHTSGEKWTRGVHKFGGLKFCDTIGFHYYTEALTGYPGDPTETGLQQAFGPVLKQEQQALEHEIWMTQGSPVPDHINNGMYKHTIPFNNIDNFLTSSNRLCRYQLSLLANSVHKIFLYSMHIHGELSMSTRRRGIFVNDDGSLHPTAVAQSNFSRLVDDIEFREIIELKGNCYLYLFSSAKRSLGILSSKSDFQSFLLPSSDNIQFLDIFGNPVSESSKFEGIITYAQTNEGLIEIKKLFEKNGLVK